jgi:BirA family biotin operon repressor/biotin-[acetyl-CoA-carboxylase] ligase
MFQHIGHTIIPVSSTESTNNYATSQVAVNEVKEGTVFLAYEQTAGRGQLNNRWESEAGRNLTFSIFLQPAFLDIHRQFMLSKVISLGLEAFLSHYTAPVKIKWPNDIYAGNRKICGILIENAVMSSTISQSIVGIGLNINQTNFCSAAPNPVSLKMITGKDYDLDVMLYELLNEIDAFYLKLQTGLFDELDRAFHEKLYRLNEWRTYKDETHEYSGEIIGVNTIGQLQIREKDGPVHEYHFKEVEYL